MASVVVASRLLLAAVFVVAGIGKLLDLPGSRGAVAGFGVPPRIASIAGTILPFAELATAAALVLRPSATWGAVAALVLLLAFVAGIANALARGVAPYCHCFGAFQSAPAGWEQIARNAGLGALAVVVVGWGPGPAIDAWVNARSAAELVAVGVAIAAAVVVALAILAWSNYRAVREQLFAAQEKIAAVPPGLPIGSLAPGVSMQDAAGQDVTLESLRARGLPVLLVFMTPGCGPCEPMLDDFDRWGAAASERLTMAFVGRASLERYQALRVVHGTITLADAYERDGVLAKEADALNELFRYYRLRAVPSAVVINPSGAVASATVDGPYAIESLIRRLLASPARARTDLVAAFS